MYPINSNSNSNSSPNTVNTNTESFLNWIERMGKFEAYHSDATNQIIHWTCIPIQIFAIYLLFSNIIIIPNSMIYNINMNDDTIHMYLMSFLLPSFNLGLVLLIYSIVLYSCLNKYATIMTLLCMYPLYGLANMIYIHHIFNTHLIMNISAIIMFIIALTIQVAVGHGVYEGIDDGPQGISELIHTKNPLYISLIPFYPIMKCCFYLGCSTGEYQLVSTHRINVRNGLQVEPLVG